MNRRPSVFLINTKDNHYKFYDMHDNGDDTFTAVYGRIDSTRVEHKYPIEKWNSIYRQKTGRKGYVDVTQSSIDIGSAVKTSDDKMALVVGHIGEGSHSVVVETENGGKMRYPLDSVTPTGIDFGQPLHRLFYKHLCDVYDGLMGKTA